MAVDVRQEVSNIDRLHKELADEVAGLPGALQSFTPELLVDYLAATFKEGDSESRCWDATPCTALEEEDRWGTLATMMLEGPTCSKAQEEAAAMDAAAERIQATIRETERTSVTRAEEMGLPVGEEDEKGLLLVRCKTCARVLLAGSCAAHEEQCRAAPAPFRPAAFPAPSSTTASVPASSGPGSISQGKPAPARRKKAASAPKSKLGPSKKHAAAAEAAGKPLPCSMVARQPAQLMRPPLYPGPAKASAPLLGQQPFLPPQHMAPRFSADARNQPGSTSGLGAAQAASNRRPAQQGQHGAAANGGAPGSQQMWASLQIPNTFLGGGLDDFGLGASLDWLDPGGALPAAASAAQPKARPAAAKPAQAKGLAHPAKRKRPAGSSPFIPHPQQPRSALPKRRLARMVTLPHVSAEAPNRVIPMPSPQKLMQRPVGNAHTAPQRRQHPSVNGSLPPPQQQPTLQQQQQMAWQLAQRRAQQQQQQSSQQAQRQSALRQPASQSPSGWQQLLNSQQPQQPQPASHAQQAPSASAAPRSIMQHWATSNGMQAMPPGAYLLPQQLQGGTVSSGYIVPQMQQQQLHMQQQQQQAQMPAGAQHGFPHPNAQHMPGATYQHLQQQQQQQQQYMQRQQQQYAQPQGSRMVPVHDAQQRVAQNGQPALLNGPRLSMQRLSTDFIPIAPLGCAEGQPVPAANPMKRSYSGDPALLPPTKKLASLQQLHHTLPMLRRPEDYKPF